MDENLKKVSFTEMKNGTKADYELLTKYEHEFVSGLPDRILQELKNLGESLDGYKVSRLEHSLQSATRALVADCNECSCLLYTSPSPRDGLLSRMPSSA